MNDFVQICLNYLCPVPVQIFFYQFQYFTPSFNNFFKLANLSNLKSNDSHENISTPIKSN